MLSRAWLHLSRLRWLPMGATLSLAALAVAAVALSVQRLSVQHLEAEATRAAQAWARQLARAVPDVDLVFMGDLPGAVAQDQLIALRGMGGLLRFRLFDTQGALLLVSNSVGTAPQAADADPGASELARQVARSGIRQVFVHTQDPASDTARGTTSRAYMPVLHRDTLMGVMEVDMDQTELAQSADGSFRRASLVAGAAMALCVLLAATLMRHRTLLERRARDRADFLAGHDVLTGTLNHSHFNHTLVQACQRVAGHPGSGLAVLCIDLDGFALVNENHGHRIGDELLCLTAERLRGLLHDGDRLARLAGDRFAILQRGSSDSATAAALVRRVLERLAEPHPLPDKQGPEAEVRLSASVGVALHGTDGQDADTLLHNAELALLRAKHNGRGCWSFYDASLDRRLQERRTLAHELRLALAGHGLRLHFQPLCRAPSGELTGYEALARWFHPVLGVVPPSDFIPVAEDTGQIEALGRWVLNAACAEAASWPQPLTVAVNLSAAQFQRGDAIVAEVAAALTESGLAPHRLELEITESLLMSHTEQVLATLHALRQLGTRIAMDDFGTGYSSLAYLWRFPFDKLKIDRAFTQGLGSDPRVDVIVKSIITLAHSLSMRVNAEGVETEAQRQALKRHGCDELQGYLLGKPVPAERLVHVEAETAAMLLAD